MDFKQQILHCYGVDEMSLREIARKTGADRKTVTRLISAYETASAGFFFKSILAENYFTTYKG